MKIFRTGIIIALILSLAVPNFAGTSPTNMLKTLEAKGAIEFKIASKTANTSSAAAQAVLLGFSGANKSSLAIDGEVSLNTRKSGSSFIVKASLPAKGYYADVDKLIATSLKQYMTLTEIEKVRVAQSFVVSTLTYNDSYSTLKEGIQYKQGDSKVYTALFARSLEYLGIQHRAVYTNLNTTKQLHVHSVVRVSGKWYHVDTAQNEGLSEQYNLFLTNSREAMVDRKLDMTRMGKVVPNMPLASVSFLKAKYSAVYMHESRDLIILTKSDGTVWFSNGRLANIRLLGVNAKGAALLGDYLYTNIDNRLVIMNVFDGNAVQIGYMDYTKFYINKSGQVMAYDGKTSREITTYSAFEKIIAYPLNTIGGTF